MNFFDICVYGCAQCYTNPISLTGEHSIYESTTTLPPTSSTHIGSTKKVSMGKSVEVNGRLTNKFSRWVK